MANFETGKYRSSHRYIYIDRRDIFLEKLITDKEVSASVAKCVCPLSAMGYLGDN